MNFLQPGLWLALAPLVALPLVLHLLNRQFPRLFRFSSVEYLRLTLARRSRLQRWRHLILLALRTLLLLALLFAFLKPMRPQFGSDPAATGARHVVIVIDHSLSLEHRGEGGTARERAVQEAGRLVDSLAAEDGVNVVLLEQTPSSAFPEFSRQHGEAKHWLERLPPGRARADLVPTTALVGRLLEAAPSRPEVYFISDFQRKNWSAADFTSLPAGTRVFFVDVAARQRSNRAILAARPLVNTVLAGDTVPLEVTIGNFSDEPFSGRVMVTVDRQLTLEGEAEVSPWSEGKLIVPLPVGGPGVHLVEARLPADALEADNTFRLTVPVLEKEEVLIVTDGPSDPRSAVHFLRTALNPYEDLRGSLLPRVVPSADLTASRLAGVRKLILTQLPLLTSEQAKVLAGAMFQGAGVIYFLDGAADAGNLVELEKAMASGALPLKLAQRHSATNLTSGLQQIARGDFKSPYLNLFRGASRADLGLLEFYDYWQASATGQEGVLLVYGDESPALAVAGHGLGTLLLLNFSAGELSSNLARQRLFPAWVQELVKSVSSDEPQPNSVTWGDAVNTEVWKQDLDQAGLVDPAGRPVSLRRDAKGDRVGVSFAPDQFGFYSLGQPRPRLAFAVNPSAEESDLRSVDRELLPTTTGGDTVGQFVEGRTEFDELVSGRPIFHWFVFAAIGMLLVEGGVQWLLPGRKA